MTAVVEMNASGFPKLIETKSYTEFFDQSTGHCNKAALYKHIKSKTQLGTTYEKLCFDYYSQQQTNESASNKNLSLCNPHENSYKIENHF